MLSQYWVRARKRWRGSAENRVERKSTRPPELVYSVDEMPPWTVLVISAVQHVAVNAITLVFPIIMARQAGLVGDRLIDFVSLSMLAVGLATILLCARSQFIGSGYLVPAGFSQIYLGPSLFALRHGGMALVFGMTAVAGIIQVGLRASAAETSRAPAHRDRWSSPCDRRPIAGRLWIPIYFRDAGELSGYDNRSCCCNGDPSDHGRIEYLDGRVHESLLRAYRCRCRLWGECSRRYP